MQRRIDGLLPLITRDPASGGELIVTRLECPESGVVIEGDFSLGWIAQLTPEQLEFVGLFLKTRGNVQKLAAEVGIAYNTARNRLDGIVSALGVPVEPEDNEEDAAARSEVLERLGRGEIDFEEAMEHLRGT